MNIELLTFCYKGQINPDLTNHDLFRCENAIDDLTTFAANDRLGVNYSRERLNLHRMHLYNICFDGEQPILASGSEKLSNSVVRVFSRYYSYPNYRTDGTKPLEKVDDFKELKYSLEILRKEYPLIIWSRDRSGKFFERLKRGRPDIFEDWELYKDPVELIYKDSYQNIFYTGDISYIDEVRYSNTSNNVDSLFP